MIITRNLISIKQRNWWQMHELMEWNAKAVIAENNHNNCLFTAPEVYNIAIGVYMREKDSASCRTMMKL
jgi:hypothetical protein